MKKEKDKVYEQNSNCWKVYIHTAPNNKKYIGITSCKNLNRRTGASGCGYKTQRLMWRAIQKYGWNNFTHEVVADNLTCDQALQMEIDLIAKYKTTDPQYGYNISVGGNGVTGGSLQPIDRTKLSKTMSAIMKGKPSPRKGKTLSPEHKQHISESLKGHKHSEETKHKISEKSTGRHHTQEFRTRLSEHRKQCKWYNNGIINVITIEQPKGFVPGRIKKV